MYVEIFLGMWSAAGLLWWSLATYLVIGNNAPRTSLQPVVRRSLSIFKPLPRLDAVGLAALTEGLESFIAQLDVSSECLLGAHEADRPEVEPFLDLMRAKYPNARLKIFWRDTPDDVANPKIAWQKILAREATGELWLWSDADIVAPPGFLDQARAEFEAGGAGLLTFPYVVRKISRPAALLETLFVNAEFYPGVLLLRRLGTVDFGLGAGLLFERDAFRERVRWHDIGSELSDDFYLGQKLQPVRLGSSTLTTVATSARWRDALAHDWRWSKTIWWNRRIGSAARLFILPLLGWISFVAWQPGQIFGWVGLLGCITLEGLFAAVLCRKSGCPLPAKALFHLPWWTAWRALLWCLCWLPGTVHWSGRSWRGPRMAFAPARRSHGKRLTSLRPKSIFVKTKAWVISIYSSPTSSKEAS